MWINVERFVVEIEKTFETLPSAPVWTKRLYCRWFGKQLKWWRPFEVPHSQRFIPSASGWFLDELLTNPFIKPCWTLFSRLLFLRFVFTSILTSSTIRTPYRFMQWYQINNQDALKCKFENLLQTEMKVSFVLEPLVPNESSQGKGNSPVCSDVIGISPPSYFVLPAGRNH